MIMPRPFQAGIRLRSDSSRSASLLLFTLISIVAPGAALADEEPPSPEIMTVTASRVPRARGTIPYAATILEGEDLDKTINRSVDDAFRFVPGLEVNR